MRVWRNSIFLAISKLSRYLCGAALKQINFTAEVEIKVNNVHFVCHCEVTLHNYIKNSLITLMYAHIK